MRYALGRLAALLRILTLGWLGLGALAALAQPVVVLHDPQVSIDLQARSQSWIDADAEAAIEQIAAGKYQPLMSPSRGDTILTLGPRAALWQHYRFIEPTDSRQQWVLEFPLPLLDRVTVYQQSADGRWAGQTAGDTVPVASWPQPGRYAQFRLELQSGRANDVYVRIQHETQVNIPVNVVSAQASAQRHQIEYMVVGVVMGALVLLIVASAAQSWVYRDRLYGWYAVYALIMMGVIATTSGMAGHLLWSQSAAWNNAAQGVLGLVGGSAALLLVRLLCPSGARHPVFDQLVYWTGLAGPLLALVFVLVERQWGVRVIGAYLMLVVALGLGTAIMAARRRDVVGLWVLVAFIPLALATLHAVSRIFGWVPTSGLSQYALMISLAIEAPLLLVALNLRSRERHSGEAREQALASQDALTGLLAAHLFEDRLRQVVLRATRNREPAAVVYVELVNYPYIKRTYGTAVAEQSLLRCVIKLRRILSDVDTIGRVDEARFGLIMEGVASREPVTQFAARLIAAGLMPLRGLKPEIILQFHVAGVLLSERLIEAPGLSRALVELLASMGQRTRRPIRFLPPESTRPMVLESDFGLDDSDSQPALPAA